MGKPELQMQRAVVSARYQKRFWCLLVTLLFAAVCLVHIESSRAKPNEIAGKSQVTVERIPSAEARKMGVDTRNN